LRDPRLPERTHRRGHRRSLELPMSGRPRAKARQWLDVAVEFGPLVIMVLLCAGLYPSWRWAQQNLERERIRGERVIRTIPVPPDWHLGRALMKPGPDRFDFHPTTDWYDTFDHIGLDQPAADARFRQAL